MISSAIVQTVGNSKERNYMLMNVRTGNNSIEQTNVEPLISDEQNGKDPVRIVLCMLQGLFF